MRSNFLLILAVCGLSTGNQPQPEVVGDVCYEKDESPVDLDALFNEACTDVEGNTYRVGSELHSCCDCFRLEKKETIDEVKIKRTIQIQMSEEESCRDGDGTGGHCRCRSLAREGRLGEDCVGAVLPDL